ncbi:MAG: hypothetical protein ACJ8GN_25350 [Longimicrobiaceae bacterium]
MSDQPGIPAITVFPPFNPMARQPAPMAEPPRDQAPALERDDPQPDPQAVGGDVATTAPVQGERDDPQAAVGDVAAPAAPVPWDFAPAGEADPAGDAPISDEEDLPWLEVPEQAPPRAEDAAAPELKADEAPNWMDWVRDAGPHDEEAVPIADLQPEDAQPWAPETETAADDWASSSSVPAADDPQPDPQLDSWQAPSASEGGDPQPDPWQAPPSSEAGDPQPDPWPAPPASAEGDPQPDPQASGWAETEYDVPEPELYDLPPVGASAEVAAEPGWELPAQQPAADAPPAWESFASAAAPDPQPEPQAASGPFAEVAGRLRQIADALSADPNAFLSGAQGGGDPLALLVAGFVLGYNARQGGRG